MSKLNPSISGIVCFFWIAAWSWWLSRENGALSVSSNQTPSSSICIVAPDTVFTSTEIFSFHKSDDVPIIPQDNIGFLKALATYLVKHPDQSLMLVGTYLSMPYERNQSPHPNLGIARSNAIKKILVAEGANPDNIQTSGKQIESFTLTEDRILGGVDFIFGEMEKKIDDEPEEVAENNLAEKEKTPDKRSAEITEENQVIIFEYLENEFALSKKSKPKLDELRRLVRNNPSYKLIISGYSNKQEEQTINNLAERRSLAVRRYLVDTGVRRRNIIVESYPGDAKNEKQRKVEISIVK